MPSINVEEWGWERKNDEYFHRWMTLPEASKACQELVKCGCTQQCTKGRCKCRKSILLALNFVIVKVVANDKRLKKFESSMYSYIPFI